jgi:DNA-binding beta-propeller fold protein YncE
MTTGPSPPSRSANPLWTASPRGQLVVVDTVAKKVAATLDARVTGANRVKFTPDGKRVLVSLLSAPAGAAPGNIVVFDAASRKEIKRIDAGGGVGGILMQPDGARAFGSARSGVVVIDLNALAVTGRIDAGARPDGLAWVD